MPGRSVPVADTIAGCDAILSGACDDWPESAFYMVGALDEARDKAHATRDRAEAPAGSKEGAAS